MTSYTPPAAEIRFILNRVLAIRQYAHLPAFATLDEDVLETIVEEAGRFCAELIHPLNAAADRAGCTRAPDGSVATPPGFRQAYAAYAEAGWGTLALPEAFGGQGMPHLLATVVEEYLNSACQAFTMYPGLTHGAVGALLAKGSAALKDEYLPRLVSGEWLGTMALTEPQCGTDLGLIRTRADRQDDRSYRISGEKIFCSGGEHDLTDNIVHLVLARAAGAPAGTRGLSLFVVPKVLADGGLNSVSCSAIEHKMGLKGSATCAMQFEAATGYIVGAEGEGLAAMFVMMNAARLSCGNQGLAQAELALQNAARYALDRRQGRAPGERGRPGEAADAIIAHPDVRRMLMDARAFAQGFRALVLWTALQIDLSHGAEHETERQSANELVGFLTPVIKAYGTDQGFRTAVAMQQVLGGHGYIAEWGLEQIVRDARAAMLYEGANGVQALDLVGRKLLRDGGAAARRFFALVEADCAVAPEDVAGAMRGALEETRAAAEWLLAKGTSDQEALGAGSYPFLEMVGLFAVGWMWARIAAIAAGDANDPLMAARIVTARYYATRRLPALSALRREVEAGAGTVMALSPEAFVDCG